jgi:hypothetical protein
VPTIQAKNSQIETRIFESQQCVEELKDIARMTQEQLEQWIQAARDKKKKTRRLSCDSTF